jgi:hypothetical protein
VFSLRFSIAACARKTFIAPPRMPTTHMLAKLPGQERPRGVGGRRDAVALRARASFSRSIIVGAAPIAGARSGKCCSSRNSNADDAMAARCARTLT